MRAARVAVPDLVSNTYFPAIAAIVLDLFNREGLDVMHELIFPNDKACHWAICVLAALAPSVTGRRVMDKIHIEGLERRLACAGSWQ